MTCRFLRHTTHAEIGHVRIVLFAVQVSSPPNLKGVLCEISTAASDVIATSHDTEF